MKRIAVLICFILLFLLMQCSILARISEYGQDAVCRQEKDACAKAQERRKALGWKIAQHDKSLQQLEDDCMMLKLKCNENLNEKISSN